MATIKVCDICRSQKDVNTKFYATSMQTDPAGGRAEEIGEYHDLCTQCDNNVFAIYLKKLRKIQGIEQDLELLSIIKSMFES